MHPNRCHSKKDVTKGIGARVLFGIIGLVGIMLATMVTKNNWYWLLALTIPLLIAEGLATIKYKKKWKCVVPCIVIYMLMVVPSLIIIELQMDMLDTKQVDMMISSMASNNMSMAGINKMMFMPMEPQQQHEKASSEVDLFELHNMSSSENISAQMVPTENLTNSMNMSSQSLEMYLRMKVALFCPEESGCTWDDTVQIYKQFFIVVLIIGLWLEPFTILKKKEKAELLLINFGAALDVLEFLEMANGIRKKIKATLIGVPHLLPVTLTIWTWSLLQFTLIFKPEYFQKTIVLSSNYCSAFWEAFISLILMEIPFLVFRLVMIFHFGCYDKMIIFFTIKNLLIILMHFYRLYALQTNERENNDTEHESTELQPMNDA